MKLRRGWVRIFDVAIGLALLVGLSASRGQPMEASAAQIPGTNEAPFFSAQEIASYDNFGSALAVKGDWLIAGAPGTELEKAHNGGAAYIFQRQGKDWKEVARLEPSPAQAYSGFGWAVDIDGGTAVVGARYEFNPQGGNGSGAVYVYVQKDGAWELQARLAAQDGAPFDLFGDAVALSGNLLAVGARAADGPGGERNSGAVYVYQRQGDQWYLQDRLAPADLGAEDHFGIALALEKGTLMVGAPGNDLPEAANSGMVVAYALQAEGWKEAARLRPVSPAPEGQFGLDFDLSGDTLAVLAPQEYQQGEMPPSAYAWGGNFGVVYVFERQAGQWKPPVRLVPTSTEGENPLRLEGIALEAGIGAPRIAIVSMGMGNIYRYEKQGSEWQPLKNASADARMLVRGGVMALSGDQIFLANRLADLSNPDNLMGDSIQSGGFIYIVDWTK